MRYAFLVLFLLTGTSYAEVVTTGPVVVDVSLDPVPAPIMNPVPASIQTLLDSSVCIDNQGVGFGSGTIITSGKRGTFIVTAAHVIKKIKKGILVKMPFYDNAERTVWRGYADYGAEVIGFSKEKDLAILKLKDTDKTFTAIDLSEAPGPTIGDDAVTVGCALGRNPYITRGVWNAQPLAPANQLRQTVSSSAEAIMGNSGGAMAWLNPKTGKWELVGVATDGPNVGGQFMTHMLEGTRADEIGKVPMVRQPG